MQAFTRTITSFAVLGLALAMLTVPYSCKKALNLNAGQPTPQSVFDEAWQKMDQYYSMFSVKGLNWDSIGTAYRGQVKNDMGDKQLFNLLSDLLLKLNDGHVALISTADTSVYRAFYTAYPRNFNYANVINYYLKNNYTTAGHLIYKIENNLGYLYYGSFYNTVTDAEIDKVLNSMAGTRGLIIDVRNNTGGNASNAERLASRFLSSRKLVKYETFKNGSGHNDFAAPEPYYISPAGNQYTKPVCVLVNRTCYSTCNDFVLYMSGLPNTILVGDQTGGGGGIPNNFVLANGWKLQFTSSITLSPEKKNIENGIKASVAAAISTQDEANGKDPILEKAIQLLQ